MENIGYIRTRCLKFLISHNMSVREFRKNAERTRLKTTKDLNKVESHIKLWKRYKWI